MNITGDTKVTCIRKDKNYYWKSWKKFKECTAKEKEEFNLAQYPSNCILFDRDLNTTNIDVINKDYLNFIKKLNSKNILRFTADRSPHGYHILVPIQDFDKYDEDIKNEVKRILIKELECDESKISNKGVISIAGRPHFKDGNIYRQIAYIAGKNKLDDRYYNLAKDIVKAKKNMINQLNTDTDFTDYFEKDPFWKYIKTNKIPENSNRDMTIFPNLAIAAVKSGKSDEEIRSIIEPVIKENFPGKNYAEFYGWLKKARAGEINTYNPFQLNLWTKEYASKELYDLKPIELEEVEEIKDAKTKFKIYWDDNLDTAKNINTTWLIDKWLPCNDICFVAGKAASYKSTICLHFAYAISRGKLVFNKYKTLKKKVLYLNEENSANILLSMIDRVKRGLDIEDKDKNIAFSILEGIRLDKADDLKFLINFINKYNIEVLICDSFRRFIGFDENNATEINKIFNNLKYVRKHCNNLTIIILHHLKKDNGQYVYDLRDMLRGSSDIVNSADSIIGIKRKHGSNAIRIEHIKNRSGEELTNKIVLLDSGEKKDMAYLYESDKTADKTRLQSKPDKCAEEIIKYIKDNNITSFRRADLKGKINYSYDTITKALKLLDIDQSIISFGSTKNRQFKLADFI